MNQCYCIAVFRSRYDVTEAYRHISRSNIVCRIISVPRQASSGCGICIQFNCADLEKIKRIIYGEYSTFSGFFSVSIVNGKVLVARL